MVSHRLMPGLDGHCHRIGSLIAGYRGFQHVFNGNIVPLRQRNQQGKNRGSQMDNPAVRPVVEIQRVSVQAVQENGLLQRQVLSGPDGPERAGLRPGEIKIAVQFFLLESRARAGYRQVVQQAAAGSA